MSIWGYVIAKIGLVDGVKSRELSQQFPHRVYFARFAQPVYIDIEMEEAGDTKTLDGMEWVCVKKGITKECKEEVSTAALAGTPYLNGREITDLEGEESKWVQEPMYSFMQTFKANPKRFKFRSVRYDGPRHVMDQVIDVNTHEVFNCERMYYPYCKPGCPGLEGFDKDSLDWVRGQLQDHLTRRVREIKEKKKMRSYHRLMKLYKNKR